MKNILKLIIVISILLGNMNYKAYSEELDLSSGVKEIAGELAREFSSSSTVIAVIPFVKSSGEENEFGNIISEELVTELYKTRKFSIVERGMLNKIIKENSLALEGVVDSQSAASLGMIIGAAAVCTGSFTDYGERIKLNARMIESKTGKIVAAASIQIEKENYMVMFLKSQKSVDIGESSREESSSIGSTKDSSKVVQKTESINNTKKEEKSEFMTLLEDASNRNLSSAQFKLGYMYYYGDGVEVDYKKAYEWFKKAADQEHVTAISWLGYFEKYGYGRSVNLKEAYRWFEMAAGYNDAYSENKLGEMSYYGEGTEKNSNDAFYWFERAANNNNITAMSWLGYLYGSGIGVEKNYEKAYKWYSKAADQNDGYSQNALGEYYYNGYYVTSDYKKAYEWFEKASNNGNIKAKSWLGYMYRNGIYVGKNGNSAVEYFKKAADGGDSYSMRQLGEIYYNGDGITADSYEAYNWFKKGAEKSDLTSMSWMGYMYRYGYGTSIDYRASYDWFEKAAEAGDGYSNYMLGDIYEVGMGEIKKDLRRAQEYFKKAVEYGYEGAKSRINNRIR